MHRTLSNAPVCPFFLEGEMVTSWAMAKVWLDGQGFRRNMENCWQGNLGKMHVDKHFWMGENAKIFVSHVNVLLRITSEKNNFNNQMDRMTHFVATSQLLSPATVSSLPLLTRSISGHGVRDRVYALAQEYGLLLTKVTWLEPLLCAPNSSSKEQYWVSNIGPFPRVIRKLPSGRLVILYPLHHGRSSILSFLE